MLIKYISIFILTLFIPSFCSVIKDSKNDELIKIVYLDNYIFSSEKESKIAQKIWREDMKSRNLNMDILKMNDANEAIKLFEDKKISALVWDLSSYYKYKNRLDKASKYKWILSKTNRKFSQYYLIKNRESNFSFKNITKKKIYYNNPMSKLWLDMLLLKNKIKYTNTINNMEKLEKPKNLIFNIFFDKNKLSIVSRDIYDSMVEFNPQIEEKIVILKKSDAIFFRAIGFTRKGLSEKDDLQLREITDTVNNLEENLEVANFTKVQKIFLLKEDDLNNTNKFFEEYYKLKKSN